jgi:hypothetical protein
MKQGEKCEHCGKKPHFVFVRKYIEMCGSCLHPTGNFIKQSSVSKEDDECLK